MSTARAALERLREGNGRFASAKETFQVTVGASRRVTLVAGQRPFAAILGCSDSRVTPELLFGAGLGELFVIRAAGNIVTPAQAESVEFAVTRFGVRLVVVLGHSQCGAVQATVADLSKGEGVAEEASVIVDCLRPSIEPLLQTDVANDPDELVRQVVRANIVAGVHQLRHGSKVLTPLIETDGLAVVGAEYSLESGLVDFFEDLPVGC